MSAAPRSSSYPRNSRPRNGIASFFLWSAGSDLEVLDRVPRSETIKQIGYGTLVVVPAVLAFFAMSYALSTLTESRLIYLAGGFVWSLVVFCFDRFIVSTFRKSESTINDLTSMVFISRLAFAAFVGLLVAHPLVMLYFNDSIEERLAANGRQKVAAIETSAARRFQRVAIRLTTRPFYAAGARGSVERSPEQRHRVRAGGVELLTLLPRQPRTALGRSAAHECARASDPVVAPLELEEVANPPQHRGRSRDQLFEAHVQHPRRIDDFHRLRARLDLLRPVPAV